MHVIQKTLLKRLIDDNGLSYSNFTKEYDHNDNVLFHLNRLTELGYITKRQKQYFITKEGLSISGTYDLTDLCDKRYKTIYVGFVCKFGDRYLIRGRKGHSSEFYKLPGGKPLYGKSIENEISRLFELECGLCLEANKFKFDSIHHKLQKTSTGEILFDDTLFVYIIELDETEFKCTNVREHTAWYTLDEILKLGNCWPEIDKCIFRHGWRYINSYEFISNYVIEDSDL